MSEKKSLQKYLYEVNKTKMWELIVVVQYIFSFYGKLSKSLFRCFSSSMRVLRVSQFPRSYCFSVARDVKSWSGEGCSNEINTLFCDILTGQHLLSVRLPRCVFYICHTCAQKLSFNFCLIVILVPFLLHYFLILFRTSLFWLHQGLSAFSMLA